MANRMAKYVLTDPRRVARKLSVVALPVTRLRSAPNALNDARTVVDAKLDAALEEAIKQSIGSTSTIVEDLVDKLELSYRDVLDVTLEQVIITKVVPALRKARTLDKLAEYLATRGEPADAPKVATLLAIDTPLAKHPLFVDDVRRSKLAAALRVSGIAQDALDKLDASRLSIEGWNDLEWDAVVANQTLTVQQRDDLRFAADLSRLTEDMALVEVVRKANVRTIADLVELDAVRWLQLVRETPTSVPPDLSPEAYAAALDKTVQRTYPSQYFAARIVDAGAHERLASSWQATRSVFEQNPELLIDLDASDVDWTGHDERELAGPLRDVLAMFGLYRHLGLAEVAGDRGELGRRLGALARFLSNNRDHDLRYINLFDPEAAIDWTGIDAADQARVRNQVLAYQRVLALAPQYLAATALLRSGFDSSTAIGGLSYNQFQTRTGLADDDAVAVYRKASQTSAQVAHGLQLQKDALSQFELGSIFQGIAPRLVNDLNGVDGYAELFGNTAYCECDHCRSIFSPAAYFTDLMYFIDKNITKVAFAGKPNHPIRLRTRRPDLWHLKLTCANTDTLIPHLTLVNEILESYLQRSLSIAEPAKALAADRRAIGLPFHTPLATVREYLREWNIELGDAYALLGAPAAVQHAELLGLADAEWARLVASQPDTVWIHFPTADHTRIDVVDFLRFSELTRDQLDELAATNTAGDFAITRVKVSDDIQSEKEVVQNLTTDKLDRIGRLLRLARSSGFSLAQLDALLTSHEIANGDDPFTAGTLSRLARFKRLRDKLDLSIDQLIGVLDHIPVRALAPRATSLGEKLGLADLALPATFHHAHVATATPDDATVDPKLPALLRVTGLAEADLLLLLERCTAFAFDASGNVPLTATKVSLLYAYGTLAKMWRISVRELADVVGRLLAIESHDFRTLDLLEQLVDEIARLRALPFSISDAFALADAGAERITLDQVTATAAELQQSGARMFGRGVLTAIAGITSDQAASISSALLAAGLVEQQGEQYALTAAYTTSTDLAGVLAPGLPIADIQAALLPFHFVNVLPNALAALAGLDIEQTSIAFAFARIGWAEPEMLAALNTAIVDGVAADPSMLAPLVKLANDVARVGSMFDELDLDVEDAWFVAQYPAVFGIADIRALDVRDVIAIQRYRAWRKASRLSAAEASNLAWQYHVRSHGGQALAPSALFGGAALAPIFAAALAEHSPRVPGPPPAFSSEVLVASPLDADELALWAERAELDVTVLRSVFLSIALPANAIDGFARALELYRFCERLGTRAASLSKLQARDFDAVEGTAAWLRGLVERRYADKNARKDAITAHTRPLDELRRDALCAFIIARDQSLGFRDRSDLYAYFLIDVDMAGCFDTSRLVAALSSLQLYVYRCLANLEQAKSDGLSVLPAIDAEDIQAEWEWRKNYRVWEANRKVFLYPESYIEPELRDNKTAPFETLEDDLLQREITLEAAEEAYHDYLAAFSTLARLKVVAVTYDDQTDKDDPCYWFVARSNTDPYQYYVRRYFSESERWEPWEYIDVGISAPYVSALIYVGRLYLFWVNITSAEKTDFVGGSSLFGGVESKVTLEYSFRQSNGKWAAAQKLTFIEKLLDRCVTKDTPAFIDDITNFEFVGIDKDKSRKIAEYYRGTKTYANVIATKGNASDTTSPTVELHYFRETQRTDAVIRHDAPTIDSNGVPHHHYTYKPVADSWIDRIFIDPGDPEQDTFKIAKSRAHSFEYYRGTLDLVENEIRDVKAGPHVTAYDLERDETEEIPICDVTIEHEFYDGNGVHAVGILRGKNGDVPWFALMLRHYAAPGNPAATDAMLISKEQQSGTVLTGAPSAANEFDMIPVHGLQDETVFQHWQHQHWIQKRGDNVSPRRLAVRINTTLDYYLTSRLFTGGIDELLTLETQTSKGEVNLMVGPKDEPTKTLFNIKSEPEENVPFQGSFGLYYQELFFHIPFLIANQLNAQGKYEDAKYWYEKIFNPMAPAPANDPNVGHRVWQYFEFRDVHVPKLKEILTDKATIAIYHDDPFNPHAIARLRLSAYQKAIVMKYVDNLLDWADDLFTQATMESVNEAIMLYVLAAEILGPRPVSVGPCKTADEDQLTYEKLAPAIARGSEFLMYIENVYHHLAVEKQFLQALPATRATVSNSITRTATGDVRKLALRPMMASYATARPSTRRPSTRRPTRPKRRPDLARHYLPAFCVPPNEVLLGYWDRIEDRLYKIRHCLDINGQPLTLALFQPPIDPMLLVRAKAAGLSIQDVVGQLTEPLPPYRFTFLLERARQYTQTVQAFGGALLSALEKKDGEQLAQLRATHEQNVLKLQKTIKQQQIVEAQNQQAAAEAQVRLAEAKVEHFSALISGGLNEWEITQQVFKHASTGFKTAEATLHTAAGIMHLIPDVGSPFAMKYGGTKMGDSGTSYAAWMGALAAFSDAAGASAGLEASFQRRDEDWNHALAVATEELASAKKSLKAAEIRAQNAERDLTVLEKQLDQAAEQHEFLTTKFSNDKLYTYLSGEVMKLYREAYQMAAQVARQAERALQFERDIVDVYVQTDNWRSDQSGLLAGERLLLQLQRMEKAYLDSNTRELEVRQSFSLLQIDPRALQSLQQTGTCQFTIDEAWFDLLYPGQYRRLLQSVRLTIPCVVGPYVNVAAKLQLLGTQVRRTPDASIDPVDVPLTMTRTMATSHAQNDGGVLQVDFRDERYLPFEGAGAINSTWSLQLPAQLRMFDYATIADVIISLDYTARHDGTFGAEVEANLVDTLQDYATQNGLFRLVSLRHEFPDAFYQLCNPPAGQAPSTSFTLDKRHFPFWLETQNLIISKPVAVWPQAKAGQQLDAPSLGLTIAGANVGGWSDDGAGSSRGTVNVAGSPIRTYAATANAIDKSKLADVVMLVQYTLQ